MKEKLQQLMKSEGLTSSRLAEILEIQPSGISHILSGRNKPGFDLLQKILRRFPRINPDWLLLDSPQMYRSDSEADRNTTNNPKANESNDLFQPLPDLSSSPAAGPLTSGNESSTPQSGDNPHGEIASKQIRRVILVYDDLSFEALTPHKS